MTKVDKIREVRYLRFVEGVPIREICRRVKLARNTVRKIIKSNLTEFTYQRTNTHQPVTGNVRNIVREWIREDLKKKRKLRRTATRIFDILSNEHGFTGSYVTVAKMVREIRVEEMGAKREAFIPLTFDPGEAFQFDWGEVFANINGKEVKLQLAVVVLCYSRHFYLRAYHSQKQELMLDAQQRAFEYFGGVCTRGIYDNMKTAVKKVIKGHRRNLQEKFIRFCSHYLFEASFCSKASGNEKGRVENKVGDVRRNYFVPIQSYSSLDELNDRLISFCEGQSRMKKHPEIKEKTRYEVFSEEQKSLIELPPYDFDCSRVQHVTVTPLCTVAFDKKRYSVPFEFLGKIVLVKGGADRVSIVYEGKEIASHKRLFGQAQQSLNPYHYLGVLKRKPGAYRNGLPFKDWKLPDIFSEYKRLLKKKYDDYELYFARTLILLRDWPIFEVMEALKKAIAIGVLGDSYVLSVLRQKDEAVTENEYVMLRTELDSYRAIQKTPDYYDKILRYKKEVKTV